MVWLAIGLAALATAYWRLSVDAGGPLLESWHSVRLDEEFTREMHGDSVQDFSDYLALESRLFAQLDRLIYDRTPTGPGFQLNRYSRGSASDPNRREPDWNRSFEFSQETPVGGVLLLHGMSDSPYSLRAIGLRLRDAGYHVLGLRLPGHGTAPSALRHIHWQDLAEATSLAYEHLASVLGSRPIHVIGYSTGASLAIEMTLDAISGNGNRLPDSLVLISPAIRVHPTAALAWVRDFLSILPGLDGLAYLDLMAEFDPYKYNSFATNAGTQIHDLTTRITERIQTLQSKALFESDFPATLVMKSVVDATVSTDAVVDHLLGRLPSGLNELVLFDLNREAASETGILIASAGPLTQRLLGDATLPFSLTVVANENASTSRVVARRKPPRTGETRETEQLNLYWPDDLISLSHIALHYPPDDRLYGAEPMQGESLIFLGNMAVRGERGLLKVPADWLLRLRHNPFYSYFESRVLDWLGAERS